jgi:ferredoxin-NADP reductase
MRPSHHNGYMVATALRTRTAKLAALLATPLVPADYLDLFNPLRPGTQLRARIVDVRPETDDAATVVLRVGRGWAGHNPGQWVRIGVDVDGVRHWRAYSLTSRPNSDRLLSVTVKAVPDGRVSSYLVRRARPGSIVQLDQACGDFVLPPVRPHRSLFVTAGSGITPVMGILRHELDSLEDVVVVHSAPTPTDVIFGSELRTLARQGRLRLVERHTGSDGHLTPGQLAALVPDWRERESWACGPAGLTDALAAHWSEYGLLDRLRVEKFQPAVLADVSDAGGSVAFERSSVTVEGGPTTPLLVAGEAAGVLLPSGCRMGICFSCVTPLTGGAVRDIRTGALTVADSGRPVLIQTCVSAAAGPCQLDA